MSKVEEYLKLKKAKSINLPKLYIVKSSPLGVELPMERQVVEIKENVAFRGVERLPIDRYKLDGGEYPFEVDILRGDSSSKDDGYGSGFGDLWAWTYYSSMSKDDVNKYYNEELLRVRDKYNN